MNEQPNPEVAILNAALELRPAERAAYLDQACAGNAALRQQVEALLQAHEQAGGFLETAPTGPGFQRTVLVSFPLTEKPGDKIGRYKLLQQIGEGGCGVVYMAEQSEPVKRRVALKVIKLGMDTKSVIARFEAERQALAMMDHPNIAKVLDAGATDAGRPYFVMELVRGVKITEYCDEAKLSTRDRLDLFIKVCQAIQHAHQKGIIHRDIKPSNILVTVNDGVAVPKVIDFGIAKATNQQQLTDKTLFTAFEQFIGTPAYMSPEQAVLTSVDIDTRSDIYSLGVLLYEMLTGKTPFDAKELLASGLDEMRRTIREQEPARPSTCLSTMLEGELTTTAKHRQSDPPKLVNLLRGDVDWIVMKCLEKDRARRYETANGLAADLKRHLNNEPVVARPPGAAYRFHKMVRRNKLAFAAATAIATVLVLGVIVSTWQAVRATQAKRDAVEAQRKEAEQRQSAENNAREARQAEQKAESARTAADAATSLAQQRAAEIARNLYFAEMNLAGNAAAESGGISRIADLTAKWLPEEGAADQRGWEWYYLRSLLHQELFTLTGHTNAVPSVAWSPDGKRLASAGSGDRTIKVWDAANGTNLLTLTNQTGGVSSVAWSPDGKRLASGSADKTIKVWDAAHGTNIFTLPGHTARVGSVAWSLDGKRLASGCNDGTIKVWDAANGTNLLTFTNHTGQVTSVAWSQDGKHLASGSWDMTIKIWDSASGNVIHTLTNHTYWVWSVAWSPDGKRLASASGDRNLMVWDAASGTLIHTLTGHAGMVRAVSWSPDGKRLVSASQDYTLMIWDAGSGTNLANLTKRGHTFWVFSVAWSPDGKRLASGSEDKTVRVWDADSEEIMTLRPPTSLDSAPAVAWSLDGKRLATANDDHTLRIWDAASGTNTLILTNHTDRVKSVAWSPDGKHLASGSWDTTIKIWDSTSAKVIHTLTNHTGWVYSVAWSPDGKRLASASTVNTDLTVRVWDWTSERLLHTLSGYSNGVHSVAWSPDGKRLASSSWDGSLKVWDPDSGQLTLDTRRAGPWMLSVKWSPDGKRLAAGNGDTLKVWDAANGTNIHTLRGHSGDVFSISWSSDGKRLASGSQDNTVKVWDADSGEQILTLRGHTGSPQVAWSPDGKRLASSSGDGTVKIWDAGKGYALERK